MDGDGWMGMGVDFTSYLRGNLGERCYDMIFKM